MKHSKWYCDDCGQEFRFGESHYCPNRVANKEKIINDIRFEELHAKDVDEQYMRQNEPRWYGLSDLMVILERITIAIEKIANK